MFGPGLDFCHEVSEAFSRYWDGDGDLPVRLDSISVRRGQNMSIIGQMQNNIAFVFFYNGRGWRKQSSANTSPASQGNFIKFVFYMVNGLKFRVSIRPELVILAQF